MPSSYSTNPPSEALKPGSKIFWMTQRHHIVAIFYDQEERFFVLKNWLISKQRWNYKVITQFEYDALSKAYIKAEERA